MRQLDVSRIFMASPLDIYTPKVLASNGLVHEAMMRLLQEKH
jgi:hypothetical protein